MRYLDLKRSIFYSGQKSWIYSLEPDNNSTETEKEWGDWPLEKDYSNIERLVFILHSYNAKKINGLPMFLSKLKNLKSLTIPIDMFTDLSQEVPKDLSSLTLTSSIHQHLPLEWPKGLVLDKLNYIDVPELTYKYKISPTCLPNLCWISYDLQVDKKGEILQSLSEFKHVSHLVLSHAKNLDVFSPFENHKIKSIELFACTGKQFPIESIVKFKYLEQIKINNSAQALNCNIFLQFSNLVDIAILNLKNVQNIEALLKIEKLKFLEVLDCKKPFKDSNKDLFKSKGYEYLSIDYD